MTTSCEEAKVHLLELVDEKKLTFKFLPVESRVGTVKAHSIILDPTLVKSKKDVFTLSKADKNKIDKKLKSMPELSESSEEEDKEEEGEEEGEGGG